MGPSNCPEKESLLEMMGRLHGLTSLIEDKLTLGGNSKQGSATPAPADSLVALLDGMRHLEERLQTVNSKLYIIKGE